MSGNSTHASRLPGFGRLWKPAAVSGAGGTIIVIWFDEIVMFGEEILTLILLSSMAGVIYLLDILMFKLNIPRREDMKNPHDSESKE